MTIADSLSTVVAAAAAVAALIGLRYARESARAGREAAIIGRESAIIARDNLRLADRSRREAERDREREHLRHIGELIERLFLISDLQPAELVDKEFRATMNLLTQSLVGREASLPECALVLQSANARFVKDSASKARWEIRKGLQALELERAITPK